LVLADILTSNVGAVDRLSNWIVQTVIQNVPFDVINWGEVVDKFYVGVDVDDNNTVVGVDGSDLRACLDSLLPFPPNDSGDFFFDLPWVNFFFLYPLAWWLMQTHNDWSHNKDMIDLDEIMIFWLLDVGKLRHHRVSSVWVDEETSMTQF
jgi:hypothetical protein